MPENNRGRHAGAPRPHARHDGSAPRPKPGHARSGSLFDGATRAAGTTPVAHASKSRAAAGHAGGQAPAQRYVPSADSPYAQASRGAVGFKATTRVPNGGRPSAHQPTRRGGSRGGRFAGVIVVALLVIAVVVCVVNPPLYSVRVNDVSHMCNWFTTVQDAIDGGWASPKAGNLVAVDGSVLEKGGGTKFTATIGDKKVTDPKAHLARGTEVKISDGTDVEEEYTAEKRTVEPTVAGGTDQNYWAGSIHVYSDGEAGEEEVRTGKVSGKTATKVTKKAKDSGYSVYTVNTGDRKAIALTFDDGPWPDTTGEILDILKDNGAKATFFEIGNQIAENADVVKRIHKEGHQIATHTWDHAAGSGQGVNLTYMTADEQRQEVEKGYEAIKSVTGEEPEHILRAPGGNYVGDIIPNLKDLVTAEIGWNVDTEDWRRPGADAIASAIESAQPGDVILMHDGGGDRSQTVEALRLALPTLKEKGYEFVTIDELMAMDQGKSNSTSSDSTSA